MNTFFANVLLTSFHLLKLNFIEINSVQRTCRDILSFAAYFNVIILHQRASESPIEVRTSYIPCSYYKRCLSSSGL